MRRKENGRERQKMDSGSRSADRHPGLRSLSFVLSSPWPASGPCPLCPRPFPDHPTPRSRPAFPAFTTMISAETRARLVRLVVERGRSAASAAEELHISVRSANRILSYFHDTGGELHYDPARWNRHTDNLVDDPQLREAVLSKVEEQPELFLDEIADAVNDISERVDIAVVVSCATVSRMLAHNGYTRKVIQRAFITRNEANRVAWIASQWQVPLRCRVYVGEAHRVGRSAERRWAWALRGSRAECFVASFAAVRTSFFVAMAHDHLLDWIITRPPPGQTAVDFMLFMTSFVLTRMHGVEAGREWEEQPERCVLVLDNARIHDEEALPSVRDAGVVVMLLPPYSPDFNPIEDVFSVGSS